MSFKMPLDKENRRKEIQKIKDTDKPTRTGEPLLGSGRHAVYAIPLQYLTYNKSNTRFKAEALTFENKTGTVLDIDNEDHYKKIEDFIWNWKKDRNENTIKSLLEVGQQKPGIITNDGVVLSGNRRLRMMNEIARNPEKYGKSSTEVKSSLGSFEAIVLNERELTKERIIELETFYQFAEDEKVDYNPVQKYLAANEQYNDGTDIKTIAKNYNETTNKVKIWLEVCDLMNQYLESQNMTGMYTELENLEDPFLVLNAFLKPLYNFNSKKISRHYDESDLEVLKQSYFDFMHANAFDEKQYRVFLKQFYNEKAWNKLIGKVEESFDKSPDNELTTQNIDTEEELKRKKGDFYDKHNADFKDALSSAINISEDENKKSKPLELADKVVDTMSSLDDAINTLVLTNSEIPNKAELKQKLTELRDTINNIVDKLQ